MTSISSREFNQQVSMAKKASRQGPVLITDRGKPTHVLLSYEAYQQLTGNHQKIADLLALDTGGELELPARRDLPRPTEIS
jgi:prevent-host-death family protein